MKKENLVSVPFMVLGIVFCVCLVAANLLETKVVQLGPISITAGLLVFPISYIINDCIAARCLNTIISIGKKDIIDIELQNLIFRIFLFHKEYG